MKNKILRWLYTHYEQEFNDFLVESFFGEIPSDVRLPSVNYLAAGKVTLERFFTVQAYQMTKRSIADGKNPEYYKGILTHIRAMLVLIAGTTAQKSVSQETKKPVDPIDGVRSFVSQAKKLAAKK